MRPVLFLGLLFFCSLFVYTARCQAPLLTIHKGLPCGQGVRARGIIYGNGVYLAAFILPTRLFISSDAIDWTLVAPEELNIVGRPGFCYGGGQFVCVGDSGKIFTSPDGVSWTRHPSGTVEALNDVQYLNGAYYAVGEDAMLLHSPDGINWDQIVTGIGNVTASFRQIVYAHGLFVINSLDVPNLPLMVRSPDLSPGSFATNSITEDTPNIVRVLQDRLLKGDGRFDTGDHVLTQRAAHLVHRFAAILSVGDELADH